MTASEIREALTVWDSERDLDGSLIDITPIVEAARAYADLLDKGVVIIQRDEDGEWPTNVVSALAWSYYTADCEPVAPAEFCPACGSDAIRSLDEVEVTLRVHVGESP